MDVNSAAMEPNPKPRLKGTATVLEAEEPERPTDHRRPTIVTGGESRRLSLPRGKGRRHTLGSSWKSGESGSDTEEVI